MKKLTLVIDPSKEDRFYLRARLALAGRTQVHEAETALQGLDLVRQHCFDLVIVNLEVSDMVGWELVRQLVALEPDVGPVVVTSANGSADLPHLAEAAGCRDVLDKPFDPTQVQVVLSKI
jgi:CheY-like chemotaxis protein